MRVETAIQSIILPEPATRKHVLRKSLPVGRGTVPANVWAVGRSLGTSLDLIEHFGGNSWTVVPDPNVNADELFRVAAVSADNVWAVGRSIDPNTSLYRNKSGIIPSPNVTATENDDPSGRQPQQRGRRGGG